MANLGVLASRHQVFHQALPQVSPFYAVKCSSSPWILRVLDALGTNFDCASQVSLGQLTHSQVQHFLGKKASCRGFWSGDCSSSRGADTPSPQLFGKG